MASVDEILKQWGEVCNRAVEGPLIVEAYTLVDDPAKQTRFHVSYENDGDPEDTTEVADDVFDEATAEFFALSRAALPLAIRALEEAIDSLDHIRQHASVDNRLIAFTNFTLMQLSKIRCILNGETI